MRKLLLLILIGLSFVVGYSFAKDSKEIPKIALKAEILRFAIVADSHSDNVLLQNALSEAKSRNVEFVIGLGDYTTIGTVEELVSAKQEFDKSGIKYYLTAGDHDLWDSRNRNEDPFTNFRNIFGESDHVIEKNGIQIVLVDNSDIYNGISFETWGLLNNALSQGNVQASQSGENSKFEILNSKLTFVMAHKTPFHPDSEHIMGENNVEVSRQARKLMQLLEENKVDGFFSGDLHFFAKFQTPSNAVKITTVGAITDEKNFQGPRFAIVKVFDDYSWEVEDVEIR